jgi:hypothetical protein
MASPQAEPHHASIDLVQNARSAYRLPVVNLAAVPGFDHEDQELALVDCVEEAIVTDSDSQYPMGARNHLGPCRARIRAKGVDGVCDPAAYRSV